MKIPFGELVCIDLETTDSDAGPGSIIQLSAVIVDEKFNNTGEFFDTYVIPLDDYRNPKAMAVNKITEKEIKTGLSLGTALEKFEKFCGGRKFLGSWGAYFDIPFLREQYKKIGRKYPFSYRSFCLKTVAVWELAKRDKAASWVSKTLEDLGSNFEGTHHNALDDIKNAVKIVQILKDQS